MDSSLRRILCTEWSEARSKIVSFVFQYGNDITIYTK